jgi:hypothetical protein
VKVASVVADERHPHGLACHQKSHISDPEDKIRIRHSGASTVGCAVLTGSGARAKLQFKELHRKIAIDRCFYV